MNKIKLNKEFLHELIDFLATLVENDVYDYPRITWQSNQLGIKVNLYPLQKHYWRIDIIDKKKRDLTPVIYQFEEVKENDTNKQD